MEGQALCSPARRLVCISAGRIFSLKPEHPFCIQARVSNLRGMHSASRGESRISTAARLRRAERFARPRLTADSTVRTSTSRAHRLSIPCTNACRLGPVIFSCAILRRDCGIGTRPCLRRMAMMHQESERRHPLTWDLARSIEGICMKAFEVSIEYSPKLQVFKCHCHEPAVSPSSEWWRRHPRIWQVHETAKDAKLSLLPNLEALRSNSLTLPFPTLAQMQQMIRTSSFLATQRPCRQMRHTQGEVQQTGMLPAPPILAGSAEFERHQRGRLARPQ